MKKSSRRRPEVEPLESMMLLTTIVPATLSVAHKAAIQGANLVPVASASKVQVVGKANLTVPKSGLPGSTTRPAVVGLAITPTLPSQAARRPVIVGSGTIPKAPTARTATVHAMVIPGSKPVVISQAATPVVVGTTLTKAAGQLLAGSASARIKLA